MKQFLPAGSERQQTRQAQPAALAPAGPSPHFVDNRPEALAQRKLKETFHASPHMLAQRKLAAELTNSPHMVAQRKLHAFMNRPAMQLQAAPEDEVLQGKFEAVQRVEEDELLQGKFATTQRVEEEEPLQRQAAEEEELLQGKFKPVQKMELDEEEPVQGKFATAQLTTGHEEEPLQQKPNNTGLPDNLKSGIENLSGYSMDDVKVHYNSDKPAQLNAHAYAQGTDIHLASGQERHLPHEAWHVVQQAQGRVRPTMQMKGAVSVNDDVGLEKEADLMGGQAMQMESESVRRVNKSRDVRKSGLASASAAVLQPVWVRADSGEVSWVDTDDLSDLEATHEEHKEAEGHPQGRVYVKKKLELQLSSPPSMIDELDVSDAALELSNAILNDKSSLSIQFFQCLDSKTLWAFSQTSEISRKMAQEFVITYFPMYKDRFIFNLATKGLLLTTRPSEKYGGKIEKPFYPEHATSGFKWYSAALTGSGVIVLGDLKDYESMREYDKLFHSREEAESVESNAKYLMAWPWSLLVNSALVTGAIHGKRKVIGASPITKESVYKKPDNKDTFGMTVYAREMIQLILKHEYDIKTQEDLDEAKKLEYPEPATGGGFLLTPTLDPERRFRKEKPYATIFDVGEPEEKPYATIFDVGEPEEKLYGKEEQAETLVLELRPPKYRPIDFDPNKMDRIKFEGKKEKKAYDELRKNMKQKLDMFKEQSQLVPEDLNAMIAEIYPNGTEEASLPSIPKWKREEYTKKLG